MRIPIINNQSRFQEDYADTTIAGTPEDAEDALLELCGYITPYEDGDHWLELTADRTVSGKPVFFWFTTDISDGGMILTYRSWAHHY